MNTLNSFFSPSSVCFLDPMYDSRCSTLMTVPSAVNFATAGNSTYSVCFSEAGFGVSSISIEGLSKPESTDWDFTVM